MDAYYDYLKSLHLIFVITWFAGLFYLPRLFVYHATSSDPISIERFKVMERKLLRGIINPSMIAAWILGPTLAWLTGAYLDVFEREPLVADSPLWDLPNVIVSPHTASHSLGQNEAILAIFLDNLARFRAGQKLRNDVDDLS